MGRKLVIAAVLLAVIIAAFYGGRLWGWSAAEAELAQNREEAVRRAVVQDRRARTVGEEQARKRERAELEQLRSELESLRAKDQRANEFQASEAAGKECLPPDALEAYRSY